MGLSSENFERLLNWLHPNREDAGQEYQRIRLLLIKHFEAHRSSAPHDLADATMDRAAEKLTPERLQKLVGREKVKYFFRVAFYILREDRNKSLRLTQMAEGFEVTNPENENLEPESDCLEKCLQKISAGDRKLIERYYRGEKSVKKNNRVQLAQDLSIDLPSLRVRAHRLRKELRTCIEECLEETGPLLRA